VNSERDGAPLRVRTALPGECSDIAVLRPFPYQFRCVWGDAGRVLNPEWRGAAATALKRYWRKVLIDGKGSEDASRWIFLQRDWAQQHPGGAYTFHGRSDEVMNLCGIVVGTEMIESAVLRDKHLHPGESPVGDCAVVGHPHIVYGELPLAFVTPKAPDSRLREADTARISSLVFEAVGSVGLQFIQVLELPRTQTGKIMRAVLRALIRDDRAAFLRAASAVQNPNCLRHLQTQLHEWRQLHPHFLQGTGQFALDAPMTSSPGAVVPAPSHESRELPMAPHSGAAAAGDADPGDKATHRGCKDSDSAGTVAGDGELLAADQASKPPFKTAEAWQVTLDLRHLLVGGAAIVLAATALAMAPWRRNR